jgi:cytochrome c-type biogenesis protein CcmE
MGLNYRFVAGGLVIVAAVAYLMWVGVRETSAYYLTIGEFIPKRESLVNEGVRVAGRVAPGSIAYDPRTLELSFRMGEFQEGVPGEVVPVAFTGIKPDMFADGRDVIVEGKYSDGVLRAEKVMTSCPSKYEAKLEDPASAAVEAPRGS